MTRKSATATILTGLGVIASGGLTKLLGGLTTDIAMGMEDVLSDDWGAPSDHDRVGGTSVFNRIAPAPQGEFDAPTFRITSPYVGVSRDGQHA